MAATQRAWLRPPLSAVLAPLLAALPQVERLTTYSDADCAAPLCVLELFARRQDRLARRTTWLAPGGGRATLSLFDPGAVSCLKSLRLAPAQAGGAAATGAAASAGSSQAAGAAAAPEAQGQGQAELGFYADMRPDGLLRRLHSGCTLEEWFLPGARSDGLVQRTVQYAAPAGASGGGPAGEGAACASPAGHHAARRSRASVVPAWQAQEERAVACIVERFSWPQGRAPPAGAVVSGGALLERRFDLATSRLQLVLRGPEDADGEPTAAQSRVYGGWWWGGWVGGWVMCWLMQQWPA